MTGKKTRTFAFIFICQEGDLEIKSTLLAASLKRFMEVNHKLIAAFPVPRERWGQPSEECLELLQELGVQTVSIKNYISPNYPIGNKVSCLSIPVEADKLVFMDSDMICMRKFCDEKRFGIPFNAKPADFPTFPLHHSIWQQVYSTVGLPFPKHRIHASVSEEIMLPYFNAGFICVDNGITFGETWLDCCLRIEGNRGILQKRPWLDQLGLAPAVLKLGLEFDCLDERYNYPAHKKKMDNHLPYFCHYHYPEVIVREPKLLDLVSSLTREHEAIWNIMFKNPGWTTVKDAI